MKKVLFALLAVSTSVFGIFDPTWERPILAAYDMEITDTRFGFDNLDRVDLYLQRRDGQRKPTTLLAVLEQEGQTRKLQLAITDISKGDCGSTVYSARLMNDKPMGARFSVRLVDHITRLCEDYKPFRWEASLREGYGWCGTMDATATVVGNPEGVITIQ